MTGLVIHKDEIVNLRKETTELANHKKKTFYAQEIDKCNGNSKSLHNCVNKLLDLKQDVVLPSHDSSKKLAEQFKTYFNGKIGDIRESFPSSVTSSSIEPFLDHKNALYAYGPTTEDEVRSIIQSYGINCSPEDPIPVSLLKPNADLFIPIWVDIVNLSSNQGSMDCLTNAVLLPLIKELDSLIDADVLKNYRPVSNLVFLGKLIERVVAIRILESHMVERNLHSNKQYGCTKDHSTESHMVERNLHSNKQYGCKKDHSTEMLLLKIVDELLMECDNNNPTLILLLDLSAAFDTIDQNKLLKILHHEIGIRGKAFEWFTSYLANRSQRVKIENSYSSIDILQFGVPQESVLGPVLFNIYTRSFYRCVETEGFKVEGFADDHQLRKLVH